MSDRIKKNTAMLHPERIELSAEAGSK